MKIIKHGNTIKRLKWGHCNCIFEMTGQEYDKDVKQVYMEINLNRYYVADRVVCPECGEMVLSQKHRDFDKIKISTLKSHFGENYTDCISSNIQQKKI